MFPLLGWRQAKKKKEAEEAAAAAKAKAKAKAAAEEVPSHLYTLCDPPPSPPRTAFARILSVRYMT